MKTINLKIGLFLLVLFTIVLVPQISALSNESIQAKELINQAEEDILYMESRNIPIMRANESYQEAIQIYSAQLSLEREEKEADYKLVIKKASEVSIIKEVAVKASDELQIFKETFEDAEKETNLSKMQEDYDDVITSFEQERFEETTGLIDKAYSKISEIQASQTALNLFYSTTTKSIKNFLIKHWLKLLVSFVAIALFLVIFWKGISRIRLRIKLNHLVLQKSTIKKLIKEMQHAYFKKQTISDLEYQIRLKKFTELIRDIDRKTMLLKEEIFKLNRKEEKKRRHTKIKSKRARKRRAKHIKHKKKHTKLKHKKIKHSKIKPKKKSKVKKKPKKVKHKRKK